MQDCHYGKFWKFADFMPNIFLLKLLDYSINTEFSQKKIVRLFMALEDNKTHSLKKKKETKWNRNKNAEKRAHITSSKSWIVPLNKYIYIHVEWFNTFFTTLQEPKRDNLIKIQVKSCSSGIWHHCHHRILSKEEKKQ